MQLLEIRQGDSTDFFYNIHVNINTVDGLDLSDWQAYFQVGNYQKKFDDITNGVDIIIGAEQTRKLSIGRHSAYLKFITPDNKIGTTKALFVLNITDEVVNVQ